MHHPASPCTRIAVFDTLYGGPSPLHRRRLCAATTKRDRDALHTPAPAAAAKTPPAALAHVRLRRLDEGGKLFVLRSCVRLRRPSAVGLLAPAWHRRRKLAA